MKVELKESDFKLSKPVEDLTLNIAHSGIPDILDP